MAQWTTPNGVLINDAGLSTTQFIGPNGNLFEFFAAAVANAPITICWFI